MEKAIIIGCPGSGKSTFSRKLQNKTGLPLYHLDLIWHLPDRTNISREEFDARLAEILARDKWIIDGNYNRTLEVRFSSCDTVFLFDLPTDICLAGARSRVGTKHDDLPWVENELDPEFYEWIMNFRRDCLPEINKLIYKYGEKKNVIIFRTHEEADRWLAENFAAEK